MCVCVVLNQNEVRFSVIDFANKTVTGIHGSPREPGVPVDPNESQYSHH